MSTGKDSNQESSWCAEGLYMYFELAIKQSFEST